MAKKCLVCKKRPNFNNEGKANGIYCSKHKLEGMIDVKHKKCLKCKKLPCFNIEGKTIGIYCSKHKLEGMIDVKHKTCLECNTQPNFNIEGKTIGIYCKEHKLEGMIDVKNKTCIKCNTQASFNIEGKKNGIYCGEHKEDGMINVIEKRICFDCNTRASFNIEGGENGIYCSDHKKNGMVDVISKICKTHLCYTRVSNKTYEGYCLRCFIHTFPDKPVSRNYKTKEKDVVDRIKRLFPDFDWIEDRKVSGGCSRRRPDLLLDLGTHIIIIEIDENKHSDYDCSCENKRVMEISQDVGHRTIVFIRFNPDEYIDENEKKITSCWSQNKQGIMTIKKCKTKEWEERMNVLTNQIQYWVDNQTNKTVETIQLFY